MNRGLDNKIKHLKISTKIFVILGCFTPFTFGLSSFVLFPGQHEIDTNVSGLVGQVIEPSAYFNITDFSLFSFNKYGFFDKVNNIFSLKTNFTAQANLDYQNLYEYLNDFEKPKKLTFNFALSQIGSTNLFNFTQYVDTNPNVVIDIDGTETQCSNQNANFSNGIYEMSFDLENINTNCANIGIKIDFSIDLSTFVGNSDFNTVVYQNFGGTQPNILILLEGDFHE